MTPPYKVTLINLTAGVTAVAPASDKLELGMLTAEEIYQLAGRLLNLDVAAHPKAEPGIIVQRADKGWRIGSYGGRLRVYKSMSLFDEYWTVESAQALSQLPPFSGQAGPGSNTRSTKSRSPVPQGRQAIRSIAEVVGLFALGVILILVGFKYGLPHRKLGDLPPDVALVTGDSEKASVFSALAGTYVAGKVKPGESAVNVTLEGRVILGTIGKDGKFAMPARIDEQARAARKGNVAVVVTKWGFIAELPPDAVNVGNGQWRRVTLNN